MEGMEKAMEEEEETEETETEKPDQSQNGY